MAMALYEPGLGYYANATPKFGQMPQGVAGQGSDFVTAPELSPLFGHTLARQVAQALAATGTDEVWEFGAGTGALALQLLDALAALGQARAATPSSTSRAACASASRPRWRATRTAWSGPTGCPRCSTAWWSATRCWTRCRCSCCAASAGRPTASGTSAAWRWPTKAVAWADRPTALRPPLDIEGPHDYLTEIHPQAEAFIRTLAERLVRGAAFFIDYGFPEAEYYHPQRHMGTLICHRAHRSDDDPLADLGLKDITAHVNFTGIALAAQDAGMAVLGYTSQGRFLINCGLLEVAKDAGPRQNAMLSKLVNEHEMGELFKVIGLAPAPSAEGWDPIGFATGDRTHRL
jgi:SAM-dependent MidA family methyltransferase